MTKANISKSQLEVWEWKEKLYEEIKDIPDDKKIDYIIKKTSETVNRLKSSLKNEQDKLHKFNE
jgi:hypothetical protein